MITKNLAIMFTDMKGFTALTSRQTRAQNEAMLRQHNALIRRVSHEYSGTVIKTIGDSFLLTFESCTNAVLAGIAIQKSLTDFNKGRSGDNRLELRITISAGDVRIEENDVFGEPVNIASRLEKITGPNEIVFTDSVLLSMNRSEVTYHEIGARQLPGIPYEVRCYRAGEGSAKPAMMVENIESAHFQTIPTDALLREILNKFHPHASKKGITIHVIPVRRILPPISGPKDLLVTALSGFLHFALASASSTGGGIKLGFADSGYRNIDIEYTNKLKEFITASGEISISGTTGVFRGDRAIKLEITFSDKFPLKEPSDIVHLWQDRCKSQNFSLDVSLHYAFKIMQHCRSTVCLEPGPGMIKIFKLKFPHIDQSGY